MKTVQLPTYLIVEGPEPSFVCLRCPAPPSFHPKDIDRAFCTACETYHRNAYAGGSRISEQERVATAALLDAFVLKLQRLVAVLDGRAKVPRMPQDVSGAGTHADVAPEPSRGVGGDQEPGIDSAEEAAQSWAGTVVEPIPFRLCSSCAARMDTPEKPLVVSVTFVSAFLAPCEDCSERFRERIQFHPVRLQR